MNRLVLLTSTAVLAAVAALGYGTTEPGRIKPLQKIPVRPRGSETISFNFVGKERAGAVCIGSGASLLGMYVFDQHGNCVAREDLAPRPLRNPQKTYFPDDLGVVWYPAETSIYTIEIMNFGKNVNECELAVK